MFAIEISDIRDFEADLRVFASRALPFATRDAINKTAFKAREFAQENIRNGMVNRNRFTERSILVEKAKTLDIDKQESVVGSTADYMETQEFGGTHRKEGKEGVTIATSYSAGQGDNAQPRTRLPRKANKMASILLKKRSKPGANRKQRNLIAVKEAVSSGSKFVFLDLERTKGIFRVVGSKKKPKIRMVWDMSLQSVTIPRNPWLAPAVDDVERFIPQFYKAALMFQARRNNLFK